MNKQLPHSQDAEKALLGAMLIYPDVISTAHEQALFPEDFYEEAHQRIYQSIVELKNDGKHVDVTTLVTRLQDKNELLLAGGVDYIIALSDSAVSGANSLSHISLIKERSHLRRLIAVTQEIQDLSFDTSNGIDSVLDEAEKTILKVTRDRRATEFRSSREVLREVLDRLRVLRSSTSVVTGIKTQYTHLDYMTNGFQRGDLIILAARPAVGKTAFALNVAKNASAVNDGAVAVFSLEMPAEALMNRILSSQSKVEATKLRSGQLSQDEFIRIQEASSQLSNRKIYIDDTAGIKVGEIFSKCRKLKSEMESSHKELKDKGLDLIVIDYLQLITGSGSSRESRQQEVSEISRSLKMLARDMNCPVIALSQLSRSVEQRDNKRPMLSDLRESGSIEQDADIVMFLYREDYYKKVGEDAGEQADNNAPVETEVQIAKHRNGATGLVQLAFQKDISTFYNAELKQE